MTTVLSFTSEAEFEHAVITNLTQNHGWSKNVLVHPSEQDLLDNWAEVIFYNNTAALNGVRLSGAEKDQLLLKVSNLARTSDVQRFVQGITVPITRDNPADTENNGQSVFLKIFDPREVCGGGSTYQIAQQPHLNKRTEFDKDRRGDFMLLIWGMPVIHVELKNSGHDVTEAILQMRTYASEGLYEGIMNLVQVNVAMTPHDMRYFARPDAISGYESGTFHFQWATSDNEIVTEWKDVLAQFLGIPYAHELIGNFLIADRGDDVLKVMRPYQIHATNAIIRRMHELSKVSLANWDRSHQKGGYIWHTTGSGKTMTSFKTSSLLAREHLADKVVFVLDRIELSEQTASEFKNFATAANPISTPRSTKALATALWDRDRKREHPFVVTSIQKLGNICDPQGDFSHEDFSYFQNKRVVFILDEAHRSVHKDRFANIQRAFPYATFFGFTGTPIKLVNAKNQMDTTMLFGNELHRYSIVQGLRDENVLGFDVIQVPTFDYVELRREVALRKAYAADVSEVYEDPRKQAIYESHMDESEVPWASEKDETGKVIVEGIEDNISKEQWADQDRHPKAVVDYVLKNWETYSKGNKFHAIFVTSSVPEAIKYYHLFKAHNKAVDAFNGKASDHEPASKQKLRVTSIFSDVEPSAEDAVIRGNAIKEILADYKELYGVTYSSDTNGYAGFKKNVADRLAHKKGYREIDKKSPDRLDMVIVVDMLLTGYDSKFVNTLYLDRVLRYELLIQAMSRTNRVLTGKSHGVIPYFRSIYTMKQNIDDALALYSDGEPLAVYVDPLPATLKNMNNTFESMNLVFDTEGVKDFSELPKDVVARRKFAIDFSRLNQLVETASLQGFTWEQTAFSEGGVEVELAFTKQDFEVLQQRYSELGTETRDKSDPKTSVPLDLHCLAVARDAQRIDFEYLDARVAALQHALNTTASKGELDKLRSEVQRAYAVLTHDDQAVARVILQDIETGKIEVTDTQTFRNLLARYKSSKQDEYVSKLVAATGVKADEVNKILILSGKPSADGSPYYEEYGRLDHLLDKADRQLFSEWLRTSRRVEIAAWYVTGLLRQLMEKFFDEEGFDIDEWEPET